MIPFVIFPIETETAMDLWSGGKDAYGNLPTRHVSDGDGVPCRHCLKLIPKGRDYLCFALRPFYGANAYCETGPAFLCADACTPHAPTSNLPEIFESPEYIVRGYSEDEKIVYGTGAVTPTADIPTRISVLLEDPRIAFVDLRSARNNCFQARAKRA